MGESWCVYMTYLSWGVRARSACCGEDPQAGPHPHHRTQPHSGSVRARATRVSPQGHSNGEGVPVSERRQPQDYIDRARPLTITNPCKNTSLDCSAKRGGYTFREAASAKKQQLSGDAPRYILLPSSTGHLNVRRDRSGSAEVRRRRR